MTFTIGYPIYNKAHMIDEIIYGLNKSINQQVDYIFIFDGCTDNSEGVFNQYKHLLLSDNIKIIKTDNLFQLKTNNILMRNFNTDFLIIFQDDMVLKDNNFLNKINEISNKYLDRLGLIGCRDGFEKNFTECYGSPFSLSKRIELKFGDYLEKSMLNMGPLIFSKKLIDKVGVFDEIYGVGALEEVEYSLKCKYNHNLINLLLSVDLIHDKFNHKNINTIIHTNESTLSSQVANNQKIFKNRWYDIAGEF